MRPILVLFAVVLLTAALAGCAPSGPRLAGLAPSGVVPGGMPMVPLHTLSAGDDFEIRFPFAADYNDRITVGMTARSRRKQSAAFRSAG